MDLKNSETLRALMEENEKNNMQRDARGLKEVRPAAPIKTVASNPHFKVCVLKSKALLLFSCINGKIQMKAAFKWTRSSLQNSKSPSAKSLLYSTLTFKDEFMSLHGGRDEKDEAL